MEAMHIECKEEGETSSRTETRGHLTVGCDLSMDNDHVESKVIFRIGDSL